MVNGWYEGAAFGTAVDPKAQMLLVEALGEEIPARQEMGHALVTVPDLRWETDKANDKMGDEELP